MVMSHFYCAESFWCCFEKSDDVKVQLERWDRIVLDICTYLGKKLFAVV